MFFKLHQYIIRKYIIVQDWLHHILEYFFPFQSMWRTVISINKVLLQVGYLVEEGNQKSILIQISIYRYFMIPGLLIISVIADLRSSLLCHLKNEGILIPFFNAIINLSFRDILSDKFPDFLNHILYLFLKTTLMGTPEKSKLLLMVFIKNRS